MRILSSANFVRQYTISRKHTRSQTHAQSQTEIKFIDATFPQTEMTKKRYWQSFTVHRGWVTFSLQWRVYLSECMCLSVYLWACSLMNHMLILMRFSHHSVLCWLSNQAERRWPCVKGQVFFDLKLRNKFTENINSLRSRFRVEKIIALVASTLNVHEDEQVDQCCNWYVRKL